MKTLDSTILQVLAYGKLKPGWNRGDSVPAPPRAVELACEFLRAIPEGFPLPGTTLNDNGEIGFYWHADRRHYIDLEVEDERDLFSFFAVKKAEGDEPREETYLPDLTIAHFTVPFFIQHFSAIRDEYATRPTTEPSSSAGAAASANDSRECQRPDALRVG